MRSEDQMVREIRKKELATENKRKRRYIQQ